MEIIIILLVIIAILVGEFILFSMEQDGKPQSAQKIVKCFTLFTAVYTSDAIIDIMKDFSFNTIIFVLIIIVTLIHLPSIILIQKKDSKLHRFLYAVHSTSLNITILIVGTYIFKSNDYLLIWGSLGFFVFIAITIFIRNHREKNNNNNTAD